VRIALILFIFVFSFANKEFEVLQNYLKNNEFYITYQSYLNYKRLEEKIYEYEKLARKEPTYKTKIYQLRTELSLIEQNKNIFKTLIKIKKLPELPSVNNPFQIINAINYENELKNIVITNQKRYEKFLTTIEILKKMQKLKPSPQLQKMIEDFELINNIYQTKLKSLKAKAEIYQSKVNKEIKGEIYKLIFLIISILISIIIFSLLKVAVRKYIKEESIYIVNKILNTINITIIILIISFFYINNATYLITILGFASAGIAIAMKDWFMNIFGWFVIMTSGNFKVGDRIKIYLQNGQVKIVGDIIDITMTRIVILEDVTLTTYMYNRRAGRIIFVPNNVIFTNPIFNYTHNGLSTVWDGIDITITFDSNYKKAVYLAKEIVTKYSKGYTDITKRRIQKLKKDYNIKNANVEPRIFTFIEENGIKISCWYLNNYTPLTLRSNISAEIIEAFNNAEDIKIAYPTYTIVKKEDEQSLKTQTPL